MRVPMRVPSAVPGGRAGAACAALDSNWIGTGVHAPCEQRPRVSVVWAQSLMSIDCIYTEGRSCGAVLFPPPKQNLQVFINRL